MSKNSSFVGAAVTSVRPMTKAEMAREGWEQGAYNPAMAIELSTGDVIYASCDEEGNSNGCLFGYNKKTKEQFIIMEP